MVTTVFSLVCVRMGFPYGQDSPTENTRLIGGGKRKVSQHDVPTMGQKSLPPAAGIGFLGSLAVAVNNITGPGMLDLPSTFQRSGEEGVGLLWLRWADLLPPSLTPSFPHSLVPSLPPTFSPWPPPHLRPHPHNPHNTLHLCPFCHHLPVPRQLDRQGKGERLFEPGLQACRRVLRCL